MVIADRGIEMYLLIHEDGDVLRTEEITEEDIEEANIGVMDIIDFEKMERYTAADGWQKISFS